MVAARGSIGGLRMINEINRKIAELRGGAVDIGRVHTLRTDTDPAQCPDYEHDLNAVMPLFLELPDGTISHSALSNHTYVQWFSKVNGSYEVLLVASDTTLAETICKAWLQWKGVQ